MNPKSATPDKASPVQLRAILDSKVVGQSQAKDELAMLFSLHLMRYGLQACGKESGRVPNAILVGPTGVGKTHSMRTMAEAFELPFATIDATSFVPAGVVGAQIEDIARLLWGDAASILRRRAEISYSMEEARRLAEIGIVFIDEFDKLATPINTAGDPMRRMVQRRLLRVVEGDVVSVGVPSREGSWEGKGEYIRSDNWLVIVGGAFAQIESDEIRRLRRNDETYRRLFGSDAVVLEDVRNYGFLPELVTRFPHIVSFQQLGPRDLLGILRSRTESPLLIWEMYANHSGIELEIEERALALIASNAARLEMGARGLQALVFPLLHEQFRNCQQAGCRTVRISADRLENTRAEYSYTKASSDTSATPSKSEGGRDANARVEEE